jgi:hypothetical protein
LITDALPAFASGVAKNYIILIRRNPFFTFSSFMLIRLNIRHVVALIVALNYLAFRTEICDSEREQHQPVVPAGSSIAPSTITWESFDKDNAPQAIILHPRTEFICLCKSLPVVQLHEPGFFPFSPVRDKSPPAFASHLSK